MKVGIIGFGLIGASLADLINDKSSNTDLYIHEQNDEHRSEIAEKFPRSTIVANLNEMSDCDYIFVCTPSGSISDIVCALIPMVNSETVIIDTGSVKQAAIAPVVEKFPDFQNFVPGHPLGGGRETGPCTAKKQILFEKPFILTPYSSTSDQVLEKSIEFLKALGLKTYITSAEKHDKFIALTSHLTHIISYTLVERFYELFDIENAAQEDKVGAMHFIGNSFASMSGFALSDPQMWSDIIDMNEQNIASEGKKFTTKIEEFLSWSETATKQDMIDYISDVREKQNRLEDKKNECG